MSISKPELGQILIVLSTAYPRFKLEEQTIKVYYELLKDIPTDLLRAATLQCATEKDFFPSVHELRQAAINIRCKAERIPNAYEAWEDLLKAGTGEYKDTHREFLHPLVTDVARKLGWPRLFPSNYIDQLGVDRAHYFKAYEQLLSEHMAKERMLPEVRGYIEAHYQYKELESGNA